MSASEWIAEFKAMHEAARKGSLSDRDKRMYLNAREQFARALLGAQGLTQKPGETARQAFRIAHALQVELGLLAGNVKAVTIDISKGGFSTTLNQGPDGQDTVGFSLRLPGGSEPMVGRARVIASKKVPGAVRVSFGFENLSEADNERLEFALFDLALSRIA
jgi:hypothetical protein